VLLLNFVALATILTNKSRQFEKKHVKMLKTMPGVEPSTFWQLCTGYWPGSRLGSRLWGWFHWLMGWLPTWGLAPDLAPDFGAGSLLGSRL